MIEKDKKVTIHLVSDSTGETVSRAFDAVISQFPRTEKKVIQWNLVRSENKIGKIIKKLKNQKSIVIFTLLDNNHRSQIEQGCLLTKTPFIVIGLV